MVRSRRWNSNGKEGMAIPSALRHGSRRMAHTDESIFHEPLTFVHPSTVAPFEAACTSTSCTFEYLGWWSIRHHKRTECDDALSMGWLFGWTIHLVRVLFGSHPEGFPHGSDPTNRRKRRRNRGVERDDRWSFDRPTTMAARCQRANQAGWGRKTNANKTPNRCQAAVHDARHVLEPFVRRNAVKIIVGLRNYDVQLTHDVARAAWRGGASMVDVACDENVVAAAREATKDQLPICASAVDPHAFDVAVKAGASMLEVGNYDGFYPDGIVFSAEEVLQITRDTMKRHPNIPLSVTVPHTLPLDEQVALALKLEQMGVEVIQTEGGVIAEPFAPGLIGLVQKAAPSIAATHAIARALEKAHVMCASGLSSATAPMAISAGASGVGVGSAINKLNDPVAMVATVQAIVDAVHGKDLPGHLREGARPSHVNRGAREECL